MTNFVIVKSRAAPLLLCSFLLGCGGGGGGGSNNAPAPVDTTPQLIFGSAPVSVTAAIQGPFPWPETTVPMTLRNWPAAPVYFRIRTTTNAVARADILGVREGQPAVQLSFVNPSDLRAGIYDINVEVTACLESPCVTPIGGTPRATTVRYEVTKPSGPEAPRIVQSGSNISAFALSVYRDVAPITARFSVARPPQNLYWRATSPRAIVDQAQMSSVYLQPGVAELTAWLKSPLVLGTGARSEQITIQACYDQSCANEVEGSPIVATVDYVVANDTVDAAGNRFSVVPFKGNAIAVDPATSLIYALEPDFLADGNYLRTFDPATLALGARTPLSGRPSTIAISGGGEYAYVGLRHDNSILKYSLPNLALLATIPLGSNARGPYGPADVQVAPGAPNTIAALLTTSYEHMASSSSLQIFDGNTPRSMTYGPPAIGDSTGVESFVWGASTAKLFGMTHSQYPSHISEFDVDAQGLHGNVAPVAFTVFPTFGAGGHVSNGRIYTNAGHVYDVASRTMLGVLDPNTNPASILRTMPDASRGKIFAYSPADVGSDQHRLRAFALSNLQEGASLVLPMERGGAQASNLVRGGANKLVLLVPALPSDRVPYLMIVEGPFLDP